MATEKIGYEDFIQAVDPSQKDFVQELHSCLLKSGCKPAFEEKKNGPFASYKHTKLKKSIANFITRKQNTLVRIYAENTDKYPDFLNKMPNEMVQSLEGAGECKRLTQNGCSPKCSGYDFTINDRRFQKCRYNCFEFLVTEVSTGYVKDFIEKEINERVTAAEVGV